MKRALAIAASVYAITLVCAIAAPPVSSAQANGQLIFRFDTFGDEQLWTDFLQMQTAIAAVTPETALDAGLKVDVDALPAATVDALKNGAVNLKDPAVTIQLLSLNAVVGVVGRVSGGTLESIGVTCALCHSTVDNSLSDGVGRRLDGWPNRDLNVGRIIALSPVLTPAQRELFNSWGRGKFDPRLQYFNGTSLVPLFDPTVTPTFPVLIPPAYGLRGVGFETYTGDGPVSYWNNYVAVAEMGGHGSFSDPRIGVEIAQEPDMVTPKLQALRDYQFKLRAPEPPRGSFNQAASKRGEQLFSGIARCSSCHTPPTFTDVSSGPDPNVPFLHTASEIGAETLYASRSATKMYRTTPLRGVWQHPPYFHDGSAADLLAVVNRYDALFSLGLTAAQKADLIEYLKSL